MRWRPHRQVRLLLDKVLRASHWGLPGLHLLSLGHAHRHGPDSPGPQLSCPDGRAPGTDRGCSPGPTQSVGHCCALWCGAAVGDSVMGRFEESTAWCILLVSHDQLLSLWNDVIIACGISTEIRNLKVPELGLGL